MAVESRPPPSNLTREGEFNKYTTESRAEQWLVDRFLRRLDAALPAVLRSGRQARVFEVGIGEGHVSERVASRYSDAHVVGIDLPHEDIAERWQQRDVAGVFADAGRLPFADGTFDLSLAIEVLEHLEDPEGALRELARVTRGPVILSVPCEPMWRLGNMMRGRYLRNFGNTPDHVQHWTPRSFRRLVAGQLRVDRVHVPLPWTLVVAHASGSTP